MSTHRNIRAQQGSRALGALALVGTLLACGGSADDAAGSANRDPVREDPVDQDPVDEDPSDGRADGAEIDDGTERSETTEADEATSGGSDGRVLGAELVGPFNEFVEQTYEDAGTGPDEPIFLESCPVMTDDDAVAILAAAGIHPAGDVAAEGGRLATREGARLVMCAVTVDDERPINLMAGTTDRDRDSYAAGVAGDDDLMELVDGEAEGLDPDTVFGATDGDLVTATWVDGGFWVTVIMTSNPDDAFEALPAAVEATAAALR